MTGPLVFNNDIPTIVPHIRKRQFTEIKNVQGKKGNQNDGFHKDE